MLACAWLTGLVPRTHMSIKVVRSGTICECVQDCESAKHEAILWYLIEKIWKGRAMLACAWLTGLVPRTHMSIRVVRSATICECVRDCESAKHEAIPRYLKKKAVPCLHSF